MEGARDKMIAHLVQQGITKEEATRAAREHIKDTFDTGHANTWRKLFKREEGETQEEADTRFKQCLLTTAHMLQKEDIVGHVHLTDNFGYEDEHLTPGMGNTPIKEMVETLKQHGYKGRMIAEPGAQDEGFAHEAMTGAWAAVGSPIYRTSWTDVEDSYFGRTRTPTYMVGRYVPTEEYRGVERGAPFWTGLGLE